MQIVNRKLLHTLQLFFLSMALFSAASIFCSHDGEIYLRWIVYTHEMAECRLGWMTLAWIEKKKNISNLLAQGTWTRRAFYFLKSATIASCRWRNCCRAKNDLCASVELISRCRQSSRKARNQHSTIRLERFLRKVTNTFYTDMSMASDWELSCIIHTHTHAQSNRPHHCHHQTASNRTIAAERNRENDPERDSRSQVNHFSLISWKSYSTNDWVAQQKNERNEHNN